MGQKLTGMGSQSEAQNLLQMALAALDKSGNFIAAAHVAQALDVLIYNGVHASLESCDNSTQTLDFTPSRFVLIKN